MLAPGWRHCLNNIYICSNATKNIVRLGQFLKFIIVEFNHLQINKTYIYFGQIAQYLLYTIWPLAESNIILNRIRPVAANRIYNFCCFQSNTVGQ